MEEIWKPVQDYEWYLVSNIGRVKSIPHTVIRRDGKPFPVKETILRPFVSREGYKIVTLIKRDGDEPISKHELVHRLVAQSFLPLIKDKDQVNHKDGDTLNNCVDNLEWVTRTENMQHALKTGLWHPEARCGEKHPMSKLTKDQVLEIKKLLKQGTMTQTSIAKLFGVKDERISRIKYGLTWKNI